jgi:glycosyltransferase involved in cell wall biosynthesis
MRVCWISGQFADGESAVLVSTIAALLSAAGHHLTYWPLGPARPFWPSGFADYIDGPRGLGPMGTVQVMGAIRRQAARWDVIVVEQDLAWEFRILEAVANLRRRPGVWLLALLPLTYYLAGRGEHRIGRARRLAELLLPRFDRILTLSSGVARDLEDHFGVPPERLRTLLWPAPPPPTAAAGPGLEVVTVGSVTGLKGVEILVDAVGRLRRRGLDARVRLVGGGERLPQVLAEAEAEHVPVAVEPLEPNVVDRLATSHVFCGPQWLDGTGWDYVAAAAAGLPLCGVAAPEAPAEILLGGTLGRLVGLGETDQLEDVLYSLMADGRVWAGFHRGSLLLADRHRGPAVEAAWKDTFSPSASSETP